MTNLEFLECLGEEKLQDIFGRGEVSYLCQNAYYAKNERRCTLECKNCPLDSFYNSIKALQEEHIEKVKLTDFERALLTVYPVKEDLFCDTALFETKQYGEYFLGIPRVDMTIQEILDLNEQSI